MVTLNEGRINHLLIIKSSAVNDDTVRTAWGKSAIHDFFDTRDGGSYFGTTNHTSESEQWPQMM
jgi:hypothetical protein